jgi:hypothetical protein
VYVEGTLYPSISLLQIGRGIIMPTPQGWEGNDAGVRTLPLLRSRHKNPLAHTHHDLHRFGS